MDIISLNHWKKVFEMIEKRKRRFGGKIVIPHDYVILCPGESEIFKSHIKRRNWFIHNDLRGYPSTYPAINKYRLKSKASYIHGHMLRISIIKIYQPNKLRPKFIPNDNWISFM